MHIVYPMCPFKLGDLKLLENMTPEQFATTDGVILPAHVGETVPPGVQVTLPACFQMITALKWVNPFASPVWVNYNAALNVSVPCIPVDYESMVYLSVNIFASEAAVAESVCLIVTVNVQNSKLCDPICLHHQQYLPILTESQNELLRAPTATYKVVDSLFFFVFHARQCLFPSLAKPLKLYGCYLSQYQPVWFFKCVIHWCNHLCCFILQNLTLLVDFDLTPQQLCKIAHLSICWSQYYKHDFAAISSDVSVSANIVALNFVKYAENLFHFYIS